MTGASLFRRSFARIGPSDIAKILDVRNYHVGSAVIVAQHKLWGDRMRALNLRDFRHSVFIVAKFGWRNGRRNQFVCRDMGNPVRSTMF